MTDENTPLSDQVFLVSFTKQQLEAIPLRERCFVFTASHVVNELQMLQKIAFFCTNDLPTAEPHRRCQLAQAAMLGRLLHGKLHEANQQLTHFGDIIQRYSNSQEITLQRAKLNKYFGDASKNLTTHIRKNYAFHYSPEAIEAAFQKSKPDAILNATLSRAVGNSMMTFVEELVTSSAVQNSEDATTPESRTFQLLLPTLEIAGYFTAVMQSTVAEVIEFFSPGALHVSRAQPVDLDGLQYLQRVSVPFLVKT